MRRKNFGTSRKVAVRRKCGSGLDRKRRRSTARGRRRKRRRTTGYSLVQRFQDRNQRTRRERETPLGSGHQEKVSERVDMETRTVEESREEGVRVDGRL